MKLTLREVAILYSCMVAVETTLTRIETAVPEIKEILNQFKQMPPYNEYAALKQRFQNELEKLQKKANKKVK